ncbi:MAG: succinate dehydrogenase, cytochrome b556 subunit [Pseudomonadota bacterium]
MASSDSTSPARGRPLSPHLQVYRLPLVAVLSITHRATGVANTVGLALLTTWLVALATGPAAYDAVMGHMTAWYGLIALFGWTVSIYYHLSNGIRHLFWDVGYGYELRNAYLSGYAVVASALTLSAVTWFIGFMLLGKA